MDKIANPEVIKRIREIKGKSEFADELKLLQEYLGLIENEAKVNCRIKDAELDLDKKLLSKYRGLTPEETKTVVLENKWLKSLSNSVKSAVEGISQKIARRIKELAERYEEPLPKLAKEVEEKSKKVDNHLKNLGLNW
jgi:type I restriction enzyme M protein